MLSSHNWLVVGMGISTVFLGLIAIIILCKIIGFFCSKAEKQNGPEKASAPTPVKAAPIENRQEIIAAVSAVIAEELGTDVSAIRIKSFKKI